MNKEQSNTILLIKTSPNFMAIWITSIILGIPILFLIKYPNTIFFGLILIGGISLYYYSYRQTSNERPALHMMEDKLELKSNVIKYDEIEYFQFIGYKVDKKMKVDRNWWTPRILQLHIKTINGQTLWNSIPNKMGNHEIVKQEIRNAFLNKNIEEKTEKLR